MADPTTPAIPAAAGDAAADAVAEVKATAAAAKAGAADVVTTTTSGATEAVTPTPLPQKTPDMLAADIDSARADLERSLAELKAATAPKALVERGKANTVGFFTDEFGGVRIDRIAMVAGAVVGLVLLRKWRRSRRCRCD